VIKTPYMPQQTTLIFSSMHGLWGFVREFKINYSELITETFTLVCTCEGSDVEAAQQKYGARILQN
jgi:hypothetical protein